MQDEQSQASGDTRESSATFLKLNQYLHSALPDEESDDDDAATVITNMVDDDQSAVEDDQNEEPPQNLMPVITQHSFSDDGSVDLIYNGLQNVDDRALKHKSLGFASPRSTTSSRNKGRSSGNKDISLDHVLARLSKKEPDVALPPKAAWESKVQYLAGQIDLERDNGMKLADIEQMLERKKIRAKKDTEQAKWKSRVRDLEHVLEERRKVKEDKLRKLAIILEALKKEKKEMKKYEKPGGGGAGGRWAAKGHAYDNSAPNRPGGPDRSASLVRTVEPRKSGSSARKSKKPSSKSSRKPSKASAAPVMPGLLPPPPANHKLYIGRD